ncbi:MAG: hypothetical protein JXQ83_00095, partial [Candidatus Glassbacteria bacterium]|nr:hypothetical protein [Candidatus Glassbacteria bacterium]
MLRQTIFPPGALAAAAVLSILCCTGESTRLPAAAVLEDSLIRLEVTPSAGLAVAFKSAQETVPLATGAEPAFLLVDTLGRRIPFSLQESQSCDCTGDICPGPGKGIRLVLACRGEPALEGVVLEARLCLHASRPGVVVGRVEARGLSAKALSSLQGTRFFALTARADLADQSLAPFDFHLFQGAVYGWGKWYTRIKLTPDYDAPNWTVKHGEVQPASGGFPLDYLWTPRAGLA